MCVQKRRSCASDLPPFGTWMDRAIGKGQARNCAANPSFGLRLIQHMTGPDTFAAGRVCMLCFTLLTLGPPYLSPLYLHKHCGQNGIRSAHHTALPGPLECVQKAKPQYTVAIMDMGATCRVSQPSPKASQTAHCTYALYCWQQGPTVWRIRVKQINCRC